MKHKAVFIDRDGTLAVDVKYCKAPKDFLMFPEAAKAVKVLNDHGYKIVVITNQSVIGRGWTSHAMVNRIHDKLRHELAKEYAHIDGLYMCPHHPAKDCDCRKPKPKMIHQAVRDLGINLSQSWVVGDLPLDVELGKAVGCRTIMVRGQPNGVQPDYVVKDLMEAAQIILS
jgi:histidinol-phosphate phosphatase family protein